MIGFRSPHSFFAPPPKIMMIEFWSPLSFFWSPAKNDDRISELTFFLSFFLSFFGPPPKMMIEFLSSLSFFGPPPKKMIEFLSSLSFFGPLPKIPKWMIEFQGSLSFFGPCKHDWILPTWTLKVVRRFWVVLSMRPSSKDLVSELHHTSLHRRCSAQCNTPWQP